MTLEALAAGKDIYVEKPVSHALEEGEEMVKAVEASKQVVQTGTQQRSWDHWILGKEIVDSGKLGRVTYVDTYWYQLATPGPLPDVDTSKLDWKRWLGPAGDRPFEPERFLRWRHFKASGGGMLTDLLTHWIDVVHWYMGVEAPLAATTIGRSYRMKTWEWPDAATATLEYPGEFMVTHNGSYGSSIDDGGLEFRGDKGTLKIDRERLLVYRERRAQGARGIHAGARDPRPLAGRRHGEPPAQLARLHPLAAHAERLDAHRASGRARGPYRERGPGRSRRRPLRREDGKDRARALVALEPGKGVGTGSTVFNESIGRWAAQAMPRRIRSRGPGWRKFDVWWPCIHTNDR